MAKSPTPAPRSGTTTTGEALSLEANPEGQLKYNKTSLTVKAGKISIAFTNMSPLGHNMTVASSSGSVISATPTFQGGSKTLTLSLKPGSYKFYCSVPGHRMAGMEGTLTVTGAANASAAAPTSSTSNTSTSPASSSGGGYGY